ncbi:MAG TPA: flagellar motor switch protein FliN [Cyanobacteria bacterium UBA8530]|nr:flagellar motor switch protein FliN [Cyanobacteria bacterium UBA8530]
MSDKQGYQAVKFGPLTSKGPGGSMVGNSLDLLRDIKLNITVELGRTSLPLKQVLQLGEGSVVELDQMAGEPVTISTAGKVIAQGEVVVIGSNFGVKVTKIFQTEIANAMG